MEAVETKSPDTQDNGIQVKWKNPPKLLELQRDLLNAKPIHDAQTSQITAWLENMAKGGAAPGTPRKGSSQIAPKLIRKQAEWRYAALTEPFLSTDDVFNVKPVTWEDRGAAAQNQLVLNHQFNTKINKTAFIDEYVRTAVDEGTVVVRTGWEASEESYEEESPDFQFVIDPAFQPTLEQIAELKAQDPEQFATLVPEELKEAFRLSQEQGNPVRPILLGVSKKTKTRMLVNQPTLEVCDYRNVVVDPMCKGDIDKANFVGYSFESCKAELQKDGKYKNLDKIVLGATSLLATPDHTPSTAAAASFNFDDDARKKFVVQEYWGYWDIEGDGVLVPFVCAWVGQTMIRLALAPYPDKKLPFVMVQYLPKRKATHGEPDGALLEDNQKVIGAVTRGMIDIMGKSANGQTGMRKDMLDGTNRRKFENGEDYEFNPNVDPRAGVHMHTYPEIPQSAQWMLQMQNMDAESLTGVKSFSQGVSGQSLGDVAAGVRGALDASSKRELGILRRLAAGMVKIGQKIIAMNGVFLSEEEVVRITNDDFVRIRRDDLAGNFDLRLSISTAEEDNNKAQELAFMLQTLGNSSDPGITKMILSDIAKLRKMPDLAKRIEAFQPQPDPMQQQMQQLQMALLQAQIEKEQSITMLNMAQAGLAGMKQGTEQAKTNHLAADTDQKSLNFVEQESGVTQERNLELHGAQARAQAQLKVLDHGFNQERDAQKQRSDFLKEYLKARMKPKAE